MKNCWLQKQNIDQISQTLKILSILQNQILNCDLIIYAKLNKHTLILSI